MKRRILLSFVAAVLAVPFVAVQQPGVAHADGFLVLYSTYTYVIDPVADVVHVRADIRAGNSEPYMVYRPVEYLGFDLPFPVNAVNIKEIATGKVDIRTRPIPGNKDFVAGEVPFVHPLVPGVHLNMVVTWDLVGSAPRSADANRVNPAFTAFRVFGYGDPNFLNLRIIAPDSFTLDNLPKGWTKTEQSGQTSYTINDIADPDTYGLILTAHDNSALATTSVTAGGGQQFDVHAWPDDTQWQAFMTTQIRDGVPVLQKLVGVNWPVNGKVNVFETVTPYVYGYAGWFSATNDEIDIGENLDQEVMLHELSHAWFNENWFADRWLNEGFAQAYSNLAVKQLGGTPSTPKSISTTDKGAVTLTDWSNPDFTDGTTDREQFGYNASFWVVQQLLDEIGVEKMQKVLATVDNGQLSYPGSGTADSTGDTTDWRRFIDLVENLGGSKKADELFKTYVVPAGQQAAFDDRAAARRTYATLVQHGGSWSAPLLVRRDMATWNFAAAARDMKAADAVLALRDQLDALVKQAGTTYPATLRHDYESAYQTLDTTAAAVKAQIAEATHLLSAVRADSGSHGVFGTIGLWGADLDRRLNEARAAFTKGDLATAKAKTDEVITAVHDETSAGLFRVAIALVILLVIGGGLFAVRRARRKRIPADAGHGVDPHGVDPQSIDPHGASEPVSADTAAAGAEAPPWVDVSPPGSPGDPE